MRRVRRVLRDVVTVAAITVGSIVGATALDVAADYVNTQPASTSNPIVDRGCVIRFDTLNGQGTAVVPRIYEDNYHVCVGVTLVSLEANGDLRIENTGGPSKVVSVWAVPDETLAATFRSCGVSGGGTVSIVRCYLATGIRVNFGSIAHVYGAGSNIWFSATNWVG